MALNRSLGVIGAPNGDKTVTLIKMARQEVTMARIATSWAMVLSMLLFDLVIFVFSGGTSAIQRIAPKQEPVLPPLRTEADTRSAITRERQT
jgi:hypothetical protein